MFERRFISECMNLAVLMALIISSMISETLTERDKELYCGACIALAEELNWETGITDPKKKIEVGGYRIDAQGNMHQDVVPLITSEIHLTEVFEKVCRSMWGYVKSVEPSGRLTYIPKMSREGVPISKKFSIESDEIRKDLQFACDSLLEQYEDWLLKRYQAQDERVAEKLCVKKTGYCVESNVTEQMWAYGGAIMQGLSEGNVPAPREDDDESPWDQIESKREEGAERKQKGEGEGEVERERAEEENNREGERGSVNIESTTKEEKTRNKLEL